MRLFGYEIIRKDEKENVENKKSFIDPNSDDGSVNVTASSASGFFGSTLLDLEGTAKSEADVINKYRQMEQHAEVAKAIDDIANEAIVVSEDRRVVDINLDDTELSNKIKKVVSEEFQEVLNLLDFSNKGYDIFIRWYVDGRIRYHTVLDESNRSSGIQELRFVDPRKLRKIKEIEKKKDTETNTILKRVKNEYWIYNDKGFGTNAGKTTESSIDATVKGTQIAKDAIVEATSGILNENNTVVLSHLHKAIKPYNQLRMLEDAVVIYMLARAPERRVFYIDVGNLPKAKAEQYLRDMMVKHKNRLVYDSSSGEIRDDRRHMSMLEDFWLPRREGGRGTEIDTLQGGDGLSGIEFIEYFQKNLYKALNVPITRMDNEANFTLGRASEVTRDEVKFSKFIARLRARFSMLFDDIMERQLILKGVMTYEEWQEIKNQIRYDFQQDNHFQELKESEIIRERFATLRDMEEYVGQYISKEWVRKHVLFMTDDEIKEIDKQIEAEKAAEEDEMGDEDTNADSPDTPQEPVGQTFKIVPDKTSEEQDKEKKKKETKEESYEENGLTTYLKEKFEALYEEEH